MSVYEKLVAIQRDLNAPKNQYNSFGKYSYRSAEDVLEGVKPHLAAHGVVLTLSDDVVEVGGRVYVRATATITDGEQSVSAFGWAREADTRKGMDESQITGSASSYAWKKALGGLLAIDDNKDADATNDHGKGNTAKPVSRPSPSKPAAKNDAPTIQSVGALFQAKGIPADAVKGKLASLGFDGLSKVTDQSVLAELVVWAEGMTDA